MQSTTPPKALPPAMRRTTYRVPPFADEVVRIHAATLSKQLGGARVTYTQSLVSLLHTAAATLGIDAHSAPPSH